MKKAQALACAFSLLMLRAEAQQVYFSHTFDYMRETEFPKGVLYNSIDSSYITLAASLSQDDSHIGYETSIFNLSGDSIAHFYFYKPGYYYYTELYNSLRFDANGGMYGGGSADLPNGSQAGILYRFNLNGDTIFTREYTEDSVYEIFYGSIQTADNGYALVGASGQFGTFDINNLIVKYDKQGNLLWSKTFGLSTVSDDGLSIAENSKKHLIIGGGRRNGFYSGSWYPWLIETDDTGKILKEKVYNYGAWLCGGVVMNKALGDQYLIWSCLDTVVHPYDYQYPYYIALLDSNFNVVWRTIFENESPNAIGSVRQLADSTIVFVGATTDQLYGSPIGWIGKLDKHGTVLWQREYIVCSYEWNIFSDFQQTPDRGFIVCGTTLPCDSPSFTQDIWLVKLDSCGYLAPGAACNYTGTGVIEVNDALQLQLYPNPAQEQTTLTINIPQQEKEATLVVYDLQGRKLSQQKLTATQHQVNLPLQFFAQGVYLIELRTANETITKKLMKQ